MLELGKPIHTYDGATVARRRPTAGPRSSSAAREPGERLETLDHVVRDLTPDTLRHRRPAGRDRRRRRHGRGDDRGRPTGPRDVAIESAIFDPVSIRRTAQRLALRSEASSRFEKGQEPRLARLGADRTAQLIREWAGGEIAPGAVDIAPDLPPPARVAFRPGARQPAARARS